MGDQEESLGDLKLKKYQMKPQKKIYKNNMWVNPTIAMLAFLFCAMY